MSKFRGDLSGTGGFRKLTGALVASTVAASACFYAAAGFDPAANVAARSHRPSVTLAAAQTFDNTTYLGSNARVGYDAAETAITTTTAGSLAEAWSAPSVANSFVSSQVATSGGVAYWGDAQGYEHATDVITGRQGWVSPKLGTLTAKQVACLGVPAEGITGAATVGMIGAQEVVYLSDATGNEYALSATTGAIVWKTTLAAVGARVYGSAALYNGSLYVGLAASVGDCPLIQGKLIKLDAASGAVQATFDVVPAGCVGGGSWATPAIDETNGDVYITTGNPNAANPTSTCSVPEPYAQAIVKLNAATLAVEGYWQQPDPAADDHDFGSTPTLFTAIIGGVTTQLVGAVNKNGTFYTFSTSTMAIDGSVGPLWTYQVSDSGASPEVGGGSIAPASFDGTNLYVGGGVVAACNTGGATTNSELAALNPATGAPVWHVCTDGPIIGGVVTAPGLVVAAAGPFLNIFNSADGTNLRRWSDATSAWYDAAPTVSNGWILIPKSSGVLYGLTIFPPEALAMGAEGADGQLWAQAPQLASGWQPLGGRIIAAPAVAAAPNPGGATPAQPLFIGTGTDSRLWIRSAATTWQAVGGAKCIGGPAAVITGTTSSGLALTVACRGTDNALWYSTVPVPSSGLPTFTTWNTLGGVLSAGPAVAPVGGTLTFFVQSSTGQLQTRTLATGYTVMPWSCTGQPAAALQAASGVTTFACTSTGGALLESASSGSGWTTAASLGGRLLGGPGVGAASLETVFVGEGTNQAVWEVTLAGWTSLGGKVVGGVGAAALN
jgi:polyvinyl alcohol dehydrogenase (cytochrome)